jgi:hypothetical protein
VTHYADGKGRLAARELFRDDDAAQTAALRDRRKEGERVPTRREDRMRPPVY